MLKNYLLVFLSSILALIAIAALGELVLKYRYDSWRAEFDLSGGSEKKGLIARSPNEKLIWEYRPHSSYVQPAYRTETRTNRFGFRQSDDVTIEGQPDVVRVAFIGDSVTLGREVSFDKTFPEAFARQAAETGQAVEALNFGIDGYNTPQIAELLAVRVREFSPDIVVYALCLNDFDFEEASGAKIRYFSPPDSFFLDALKKVYRLAAVDDYYRYFFDLNRDAVFDEIDRMRRDTAEMGAEFHIAVVPVFDFEGTTFESYEPRRVHDSIVEHLDTKGIKVLDLLPAFAQSGLGPEDVAFDSWHLNDPGHAIVGMAVARHLETASQFFAPPLETNAQDGSRSQSP